MRHLKGVTLLFEETNPHTVALTPEEILVGFRDEEKEFRYIKWYTFYRGYLVFLSLTNELCSVKLSKEEKQIVTASELKFVTCNVRTSIHKLPPRCPARMFVGDVVLLPYDTAFFVYEVSKNQIKKLLKYLEPTEQEKKEREEAIEAMKAAKQDLVDKLEGEHE